MEYCQCSLSYDLKIPMIYSVETLSIQFMPRPIYVLLQSHKQCCYSVILYVMLLLW